MKNNEELHMVKGIKVTKTRLSINSYSGVRMWNGRDFRII